MAAAKPRPVPVPRERIKHTFPPPIVCCVCWWRARFLALEVLHRTLREELIRSVAARQAIKGVEAVEMELPRAEAYHPPEPDREAAAWLEGFARRIEGRKE